MIASWAQAAAAHARDDLRGSVWADLLDTHALRELAVSVFDGHLCMTQRLLYGARPYPDVVAFADAFLAEAERLGAARGRAFALTLRGEAKLLSGALDEADEDLREAARLSRAIGGATGEALALQRRAEVALHRGDPRGRGELLDEALAVARESDVGFHLLDRIYGARIAAAAEPAAALVRLDEAELGVRGPLETCPGCRITLAVPAAIAAARAGDLDRADRYAQATETLATVVMRLPAWDAALEEVRGHLRAGPRRRRRGRSPLPRGGRGFRRAGQPLDAGALRQERSGNTRLTPSRRRPAPAGHRAAGGCHDGRQRDRHRGQGGRREPGPGGRGHRSSARSGVLLVDVREPAETAYGGIPGAVPCPAVCSSSGPTAESTARRRVRARP